MKTIPLNKAAMRVIYQTFLIAGTIMLCAFFVIVYVQHNRLLHEVQFGLKRSIPLQVNTLLPAFLIPEQKSSIPTILDRIRQEEQLDFVEIYPPSTQSILFKGCQPSASQTEVCYHGEIAGIIAPVRENEELYGFLFKGKHVGGLLSEPYVVRTLAIVLGAIFVSCLVQLILLSRFIQQGVSKSLKELLAWIAEMVIINSPTQVRLLKYTEFKQLGTAFIQLIRQNRAMQTHAELGKLSTQVAHDIRSPLSSMRAALMLLRDKFGDNKDAEDMLNLLQLSSNRLDNIANGLLSNHMGEAAAEQLFSIHEVLDELVGELRASPLGQGTEFKKQYYTAALYVTGDKTGMARAIGNIIKNALEAMQQTSMDRAKQLTVATAFDGNQHLTIRITDTGRGITPDKIPLILQGGHTEGKTDGHGIGTKVVKEMVDSHKGHISIESQADVGTTFVITLPATIRNDETIVTIPHAGNGIVCVIDDEPSLREQWRLTLRGMGISAKLFTCWEDFDSAKASISPDGTFIVDFHFDNSIIDGLEVIRRLQERGFTNFVLATAEYWKPAIKDAAKKMGIVLCPKPLPKVVLSHPVQEQQPSRCRPEAQDLKVGGSSIAMPPQTDTAGPSILLIDDDSGIHLSWKMMRKSLGVGNLTMHSNLEEMIAAATNPAKFDLCVIDKNIEGSQFDGARTLEYLRQNGAKTIVLASGETGDDIRKDPQFSTVDGVLKSKVPMTPEELDPFLN